MQNFCKKHVRMRKIWYNPIFDSWKVKKWLQPQ